LTVTPRLSLASSRSPWLAPPTDFGARDTDAYIRGPGLNGRDGAIEFDGHERDALPSFGHRTQKLVVLFRPSFMAILTGKHHHCLSGQ
jgi:hypothetical protein